MLRTNLEIEMVHHKHKKRRNGRIVARTKVHYKIFLIQLQRIFMRIEFSAECISVERLNSGSLLLPAAKKRERDERVEGEWNSITNYASVVFKQYFSRYLLIIPFARIGRHFFRYLPLGFRPI